MTHFRPKPFQLKTVSSSTEKFFNFNCIAPENLLKNFMNYAEEGRGILNKPFGMLSRVNPSGIYVILVNSC